MTKNIANNSGTTLIELITAIAMLGIVIGLIFTTYTNFTKGFYRQIDKAAQIQHMHLAKKQIDKTLANISVVSSCQEKRIEYRSKNSQINTTLRFDGSNLINDTTVVAKKLLNVAFSLYQEPNNVNEAVLVWEAEIGKGWIGGAQEVVVAVSR